MRPMLKYSDLLGKQRERQIMTNQRNLEKKY